jgi:hypothetical protein
MIDILKFQDNDRNIYLFIPEKRGEILVFSRSDVDVETVDEYICMLAV